MVSWDHIEDCSALNGEVTAWTLLYSSPYTAAITLTVPGSNDASGEVVLTGLIFSTEYQIQVAAVNSNGNVGTYSPAVTATTFENGIYKVCKHMFSIISKGSCNTGIMFLAAAPHVSADYYSKTQISVFWNQIQLASWSDLNIVYHFHYSTKERRYITRESFEFPVDRNSVIVDVRDDIPNLQHFFTVSCNLRVNGVTYTGQKGNAAFVFGKFYNGHIMLSSQLLFAVTDKAFIQLQFGPVEHCITWLTEVIIVHAYTCEHIKSHLYEKLHFSESRFTTETPQRCT